MDDKNKTEYKLKQTQGQKKLEQYLNGLIRNQSFKSKLKRLSNREAKDDTEDGKLFDLFQKKYMELIRVMKRMNKKNQTTSFKTYNELAETYGLDNEILFDAFFGSKEKENVELSFLSDMCRITDAYDEYYYDHFPIPFQIDHKKQRHLSAYPVSLDIHQFASKRDVLDFIEKRWEFIEEHLEKKVRFRERKIDQKIVDFIWENRKLKPKEIQEKLDLAFPENELVYFEISKILNLEKKKRLRKITVGQ